MTRAIMRAVCGVALCSAEVVAQQPNLPSPDPGSECAAVVGRVIDGSRARPLAGVAVVTDGGVRARSNEDGAFELVACGRPIVTLSLSHDGYHPLEKVVELGVGEVAAITLMMEPTATFEDELTIVGRAVPATEPVRELPPETVIAMPGAGEDVLQTLRAMPGVVSADDWSGRLYVRGGRPDQNGIYLDGIPIYDPYRLFGFTSLFNPETVDSILLYPGGFDVQYGDRLSAVIAVDNRDGAFDDAFAGSANLSMTNTNLVGEGRLSTKKPASWLVSARRTYYDLVASQMEDSETTQYPSFTDAQVRLSYQPAKGHRLSVTLLGCDEGTDLAEDDESSFSQVDDRIEAVDDQKDWVVGLRGDHRLGERLRLDYVLSATRNRQISDIFFREGETSFETTLDQDLTSDNLSLRSGLELALGQHTLLAGVEAAESNNRIAFHIRTEDPRIPIPDSLLDFAETQDFRKVAGFVQDTWQLSPRVAAKAGLRWDHSTLADMSSISPRASIRWNLAPSWELQAAWGSYTQAANYQSLQGDGYFLDLRGIRDLDLKPERAIHYLLGAGHTDARGWKLDLAVYYKELSDILQSGQELETVLVLDDDGVARPYTREQPTYVPENTREGFARGADLSFTILESSSRPYYGMVSYTFGQARTRDEDGWLWEATDRRHALTLIGGWRFARSWELGVRWSFATGFPYTPLTNVIRVVEDVDGDGQYDPEQGDWITYQRDEPDAVRMSERLPDYHRLDLRLEYHRSSSRIDMTYYLDIINAYARDNVLDYTYNEDLSERDGISGMPLLPSIGVKISL